MKSVRIAMSSIAIAASIALVAAPSGGVVVDGGKHSVRTKSLLSQHEVASLVERLTHSSAMSSTGGRVGAEPLRASPAIARRVAQSRAVTSVAAPSVVVRTAASRGTAPTRAAVSPRAALAPGLTADAILLPLGDSIGDVTTITVASAVMSAATPFADTPSDFTFSLASTTIRSIAAVAQTRVAVDGGNVCTPAYADSSCSDVQDVWTFTWDGRNDVAAPVDVGDYTLTSSAIGEVGTVAVRDLVLDAVVSDVSAPFVVAPFVDGVLDSPAVTFTGTASGNDIATTGGADLISPSGSAVVHHYDFGPTPSVGHEVVLNGVGLAFGTYRLSVDLVSGSVHQVSDFEVTVVQTKALAARVIVASASIYPAVDGYLDRVRVTISVTSSTGKGIPLTGNVVVRRGSAVVRTIAVVPGQSAVSWDGRINGTTAPGTYTIAATVRGPQGPAVVATTARVTVLQTKVTAASLRTSLPTVYPVRDGYKDGVRITSGTRSSTGRAIRGSETIEVLKGSRVVTRWTFPNTGAHTVTWSGRDGGGISAGRYALRLTVKGPEGPALSKVVAVTVSDKKVVGVAFSQTMSARAAFDGMASGSYWVGDDAGSQTLWGCTYYGCEPDIAYYAWTLPASFRGYGNIRVSTCTQTTYSAPLGRFSYTDPYGNLVGTTWRLGNDYPDCYSPRSGPPASAFNGRTLNWLVGNIDDYELSWWEVKRFEITGTRYVLQ